jgi:prolyl-tRNA editing enzyme YbaK/EbsC (Cys-tRNA(Pro) deacylase)
MEPTNPSAQRIQNILRQLGSDYKVIEFTGSTRTAQEAADRVGCQLGQIVKSLIFKGRSSNTGILVLTSGVNRVDENKIGHYAGESIGRADPEFVRTVTGFAIGGVPHISMKIYYNTPTCGQPPERRMRYSNYQPRILLRLRVGRLCRSSLAKPAGTMQLLASREKRDKRGTL